MALIAVRGAYHHTAAAIASWTTAATTSTVRHPPTCATNPANTRENRIPTSSPLITVPTIAPRSPGAATAAAHGTTTCAADAETPTAKTITISTA